MERALTASAPLLAVLLGPTGSGKTALSLALAERFGGEIVNCDSVAMYREFEIGTAKPTAAELGRAPHHLFDCVEPASYMTAGEYSRLARTTLKAIKSRGNLPIVVGGTGLYLRALLEGLFPGPPRSDQLRARLRQRAEQNPQHLHRLLNRLDPVAAKTIYPNDTAKLIRAIEVCLVERKPMTTAWAQGREPLQGFHIFRIGLDPNRAALYERLNRRAQQMFDDGLVEETQRLLAKYGEAALPLNSLGYKQSVQLLHGEMEPSTALSSVQQTHRNYAKRQITWFRREPDVTWFAGFGDDSAIQAQVIARIELAVRTSTENGEL